MRRQMAWALVLTTLGMACATSSPRDAETAEGKGGPATQRDVPVDALRAIAAEIERAVAEGNREPTLTSVDGLTVDTPEVRQAVRTRAARIELVNKFRDSGNCWERRNGRLWVLRSPEYKAATTSRQRDIDAITVNGENADRWAIYEGILEANKLGRGALSTIEEVFFEARLKHMAQGQKYESSAGDQAAIAAAP